MRHRIEPRSGVAFKLSHGDRLTVIAPEGAQVSDLFACAAKSPRETLSNGRTFDYEETISLSAGHTLWSSRSNRMLQIEIDTHGQNDFLLTPCSEKTFEHFYPDKPVHRGCNGNLAAAMAAYGVERDDIGTAFNIFMHVPIDPATGALRVDPPTNTPEDRFVVKAEMDLIVGLTACSAYASNGGSFRPIEYCIEKAG